MQITYSLRLPREVSTVPLVRTICGDALSRLGVSVACRDDVALAVTEACANVIKHAVGAYTYKVDVELTTDTCEISIVDDGPGIVLDPSDPELPKPTAEQGRGIALMTLMVDSLGFETSPGSGTAVHLRKHLELEDGSVLKNLAAGRS